MSIGEWVAQSESVTPEKAKDKCRTGEGTEAVSQ